MEDKITVDELKVFVGCGLKFVSQEHGDIFFESIKSVTSEFGGGFSTNLGDYYISALGSELQPIVRPWSNLTKEIEVDGERFVPIKKIELVKGAKEDDMDWDMMADYFSCAVLSGNASIKYCLTLASWHFDIFNWLQKTGPDGKPLAVEMDK